MKLNYLFIILSIILVTLACNIPNRDIVPTEDLVLEVAKTQTAISIQQILTITPIPEQDVLTSPTTTATNISITATISPSSTPSPTTTPQPDCVDKAIFISETIPDNTVFSPGESFIKTWLLKNTGTCTWTPDYSLVLIQGDAMSGITINQFDQTIPPSSTLELKLSLIAPSDPGEYSGYWKLRNSDGENFGNLWIKITVSGEALEDVFDLGKPTWSELFDNGSSFALGSDGDTAYSITNGNLIITAITAAGDQWRISNRGFLDNFYIKAIFTTGANCSGQDSYGLIIRAPDQSDNIVDSTYVITFSCEGEFRVYRMDNGIFTSLQNWEFNPNIRTGPEKSNNMGIRAEGDNFKIFANDRLVFEFTDSTYSIGYFGLVIRSEIPGNFQVSVSEITYWDLSQ